MDNQEHVVLDVADEAYEVALLVGPEQLVALPPHKALEHVLPQWQRLVVTDRVQSLGNQLIQLSLNDG